MLETFPPTQLHRSVRGFTEENQDLTGTPVPHRSTHTTGKGLFTAGKSKSEHGVRCELHHSYNN